MSDLRQGTVLVTGGSSGLGAAVVDLVSKAGGTPVVIDRQQPAEGVDWVQADLSNGREAEAAVAQLIEKHGPLSAVVPAAGIDACGALVDVPAELWEKVIGVNLIGVAATIRAAIPSLLETHGRIVTIASTAARHAASDATAYCASKAGVVGFTHALAAELVGKVGVTVLIPGGMNTNFFADRTDQYKPGPNTQLNDPTNVAEAIMFAISQPQGCEVREMLIAPADDVSWA